MLVCIIIIRHIRPFRWVDKSQKPKTKTQSTKPKTQNVFLFLVLFVQSINKTKTHLVRFEFSTKTRSVLFQNQNEPRRVLVFLIERKYIKTRNKKKNAFWFWFFVDWSDWPQNKELLMTVYLKRKESSELKTLIRTHVRLKTPLILVPTRVGIPGSHLRNRAFLRVRYRNLVVWRMWQTIYWELNWNSLNDHFPSREHRLHRLFSI